jgi:hypothetical protein
MKDNYKLSDLFFDIFLIIIIIFFTTVSIYLIIVAFVNNVRWEYKFLSFAVLFFVNYPFAIQLEFLNILLNKNKK